MERFNPGEMPTGLPLTPSDEAPASAGSPPQYLEGLNARQLEAVEALDGPVLVLAGAGTGKTKTLTTRIAHILCSARAWPSQILAVTFTNKAANEMRERVNQISTLQVDSLPWLGTFHSISAKILRRHAELAGRNQNFTILDTDDQVRLLKQLVKAEGIDEKRWPARQLAAVIDRWKNQCWLPSDVPAKASGAFDGKAVGLYRQYQERLETLNSVDFGDLILLVVELLRSNEELLADYQRRFCYILVDEYQDINTAQYLWLRLFAQGRSNICCVGDEDQSIYGWRGADVGNILGFEQSFPEARVIRLEQNYRSTSHILNTASALIGNNEGRLGKTLWTDVPGGEKVRLIGHWDGAAEARWISGEIEALAYGTGRRRKYELGDIAVLVRASFLMRELEECFLTIGLPYRVIGGPRFYERKEIRDALAYFRLAVSGADDLAFTRIVNVPKRGVGEKALVSIHDCARNSGLTMFEAAKVLLRNNEFSGRTAIGLNEFVANVERWSAVLNSGEGDHVELAGRIIDEAGLVQMWMNTKTPEAEGRVENLKELVKSLEKFNNLQGFLEHVALVFENLEDSVGEKVSIMTLHAAKGLEFPVVFLPAWEEGVFPSKRSLDEMPLQGLEEERRLAYVGITRAMEICTVSCAATRISYGGWSSQVPSRFIDELPNSETQTLSPPGLMGGFSQGEGRLGGHDISNASFSGHSTSNTYSAPGYRRMVQRSRELTAGSGRSVRQESNGAKTEFSGGDRVFHSKFGYGVVQTREGERLEIEFKCSGTKRIMSRFVTAADGTES